VIRQEEEGGAPLIELRGCGGNVSAHPLFVVLPKHRIECVLGPLHSTSRRQVFRVSFRGRRALLLCRHHAPSFALASIVAIMRTPSRSPPPAASAARGAIPFRCSCARRWRRSLGPVPDDLQEKRDNEEAEADESKI
jgi:hypothetical protein